MPLLISASRRTDIPAFFGEWFRNRLDAGWCETRNPFSKQAYRVSLRREDVLGWIFWSRNYAPFVETLAALHADGQRFICHFTINSFPALFEPHTPPIDLAIETAHTLADCFGPDSVLWRYDPILLTSLTTPSWHRENFAQLAKRLNGATRRCYFSFPTMYKKTVRNLERLARSPSNGRRPFHARSPHGEAPGNGGPDAQGIENRAETAERHANSGDGDSLSFKLWSRTQGDFSEQDQRSLLADFAAIAGRNGMEILSCCDRQWVDAAPGVQEASCADWPLLKNLGAGAHLSKEGEFHDSGAKTDWDVPVHPTRQQCNCRKSLDIGAYQTCGHGCAYCYAVDDPSRARSNILAHRPDAPILG